MLVIWLHMDHSTWAICQERILKDPCQQPGGGVGEGRGLSSKRNPS